MNYLEIIGTIIGFVYLYLEYKASIYLWVAGFIMPAIYMFVYYEAGLYADFAINIYYLVISIYGYLWWAKGALIKKRCKQNNPNKEESSESKSDDKIKITHTPTKNWFLYGAIFLTAFIAMGIILQSFTDSNVPWLDSFTTALSIVGMMMLAKKYLEQWITWIIVDAVCTGLYIYKELFFTSILYGVYTIIAIFGYYKWKKMMNDEIE